MQTFGKILSGGDLRSIGKSNEAVQQIKDQKSFDKLFSCIYHKDRLVVMRAADAIEKITAEHPEFLFKHKKKLLELCLSAENKELKWHLALLLPRIEINLTELRKTVNILKKWALDKEESRIVRVNSVQGLYEISHGHEILRKEFETVTDELRKENIPSVNARIKKLKL